MTRHPNDDAFEALADPTRRRILELLGQSELPVAALAGSFRITQSAISQHLRILRDAGLVRVRPSGRSRLYRVGPARLREVSSWVARVGGRKRSG
jgi:DNA-binding transcriptional ArsR family regulator